ncbi:[protein-PII] uridylyltransferase family protein [Pontibaca salina]|uniref:Glutamine-synthetase adenylyltransferase n=1 Tax=Pontibaca salina TaxID=2795731 RepID=A0A934M0B2_9RHOB|nr:glutamine-synthetase adenylyltransferase [Pontibaca salina]MBI6629830.1 glutamine-synthetase adenylyltransferase [Pontibaca salina]
MSLSRQMTRCPRPYDAELGADARAALPDADRPLGDLLAGAGGSSPYLKHLIKREADWLGGATDDPDRALADLMSNLPLLPPDRLKPGLRRAKRQVALLVALADLAGAWPLDRVTGALSDFAALACDLALKAEIATLIKRGKLPGKGEGDIASAAGLSVLAMGKMGAHELNYSSDIDLICLFDEGRYGEDEFDEARTALVRATRNMCATLSDRTAEGYVFRTDLRLRPDPGVTPVCMAMAAAETYYESLGRTWERAAYIKARPCAGDLAAGERFLRTLRPFVWRRHLDFATIQDAHDMRLRIRENKGTGGALSLPGHDLKLGRGGIREIEFFTQTRQLIAGGRDPDLRARATLDGLRGLAEKGWVPGEVTEALAEHYRTHREVEHRIQMVHDAQTHTIPKTAEGFARIACLMDMEPDRLRADLIDRLTAVHELTEGFFAPDSAPVEQPELPELDAEILSRWPGYPALRSQRAAQSFRRLRPELLSRLARSAHPREALVALDGFLAGLPAGVQLFALFEANPQLVDLLVDIAGTSPKLASHLSRNAAVFDAVIDGDFFAPWPGLAVLRAELAARLAAEPDYERQLDSVRRWQREWHFRIGVHHLRGLIDADEAGGEYADLAEAVVAALTPVVTTRFARKHGAPPGRGAAVLGMGSLGAGRLGAVSDLDLIVIYDPGDAEASDGPRPLAARTYYARLTQALITALSAPMAQGRLYEVDMRLRPSGNQGPVATSWSSFRDYQQTEAWVWEHLALTRARVLAGPEALCAEIETFRRALIARPRQAGAVLPEVAAMRVRLAAAKPASNLWNAKDGAGRLLDIELLAQAGALLAGAPARDVASGLSGAVTTGWLSREAAKTLRGAHVLLWSVQMAMGLLAGTGGATQTLSEGGARFLCRATGYDRLESLRKALEKAYHEADRAITDALPREGVK